MSAHAHARPRGLLLVLGQADRVRKSPAPERPRIRSGIQGAWKCPVLFAHKAPTPPADAAEPLVVTYPGPTLTGASSPGLGAGTGRHNEGGAAPNSIGRPQAPWMPLAIGTFRAAGKAPRHPTPGAHRAVTFAHRDEAHTQTHQPRRVSLRGGRPKPRPVRARCRPSSAACSWARATFTRPPGRM